MAKKKKYYDGLIPWEPTRYYDEKVCEYILSDYGIPHYPGPYYVEDKTEWRPNDPFQATMTFLGFSRGRSAAYSEWMDENGALFTMFLTDLEATIKASLLCGNTLSGLFVGCKRGSNFGICPYIEEA